MCGNVYTIYELHSGDIAKDTGAGMLVWGGALVVALMLCGAVGAHVILFFCPMHGGACGHDTTHVPMPALCNRHASSVQYGAREKGALRVSPRHSCADDSPFHPTHPPQPEFFGMEPALLHKMVLLLEAQRKVGCAWCVRPLLPCLVWGRLLVHAHLHPLSLPFVGTERASFSFPLTPKHHLPLP